MNLSYISFTERGKALAERIQDLLGGESVCLRRGDSKKNLSLSSWTAEAFEHSQALIYIGAAGIAVRAIAPHIQSKLSDPAVIVTDEYGRFVIPILSGHWGGANELARRIANITGGTAVITTATDINHIFAIDTWAKARNCAIVNPEYIKIISGELLRGGTVNIWSAYPVKGAPPENVIFSGPGGGSSGAGTGSELLSGSENARIDIYHQKHETRKDRDFLALVPRILILGVGCRRGIETETLERRFETFCRERDLYPEAFDGAASIDIKSSEPGLTAFCRRHGWNSRYFSAGELRRVPGQFHASAFVEEKTGVDNICERAAVLASGNGLLIIPKTAGDGVTFAAAAREYQVII